MYSMDVNMYIGVWTLKMECTRYGLHGQAAFKNARATFYFPKSGGAGKEHGLHSGNEGDVPGVGSNPGHM